MFRRLRDQRGQGLVEYALIIALVGLAAVAALGFLSGEINGLFSRAGNELNAAAAAGEEEPPPLPSVPTPGSVALNCASPCTALVRVPDGVAVGWTTPPGFPIIGDVFEWYAKDNPDCGESGADWGPVRDRDPNSGSLHVNHRDDPPGMPGAGPIVHEFNAGDGGLPGIPAAWATDGYAVRLVVTLQNANGMSAPVSNCITQVP